MFDTSGLQNHPLTRNLFEIVKERFHLTKREGEVLQILSIRGVTNRELGDLLNLSEKTVKNHVSSIQRKLNVKSSRELQAVVFRDTLLSVFVNIFNTSEKRKGVIAGMLLYHINKAATSGSKVDDGIPVLTLEEIDQILKQSDIEFETETRSKVENLS